MVGDRRPYLVCVVTLDPEEAQKLASEKGLDAATLHENEEVRASIQAHLDQINQKFARVEQVKKFAILPQDLSQEGGELTPTMKIKRNVVADKYSAEIEVALFRLAAHRREGSPPNRDLERDGRDPSCSFRPGARVATRTMFADDIVVCLLYDVFTPVGEDAHRRRGSLERVRDHAPASSEGCRLDCDLRARHAIDRPRVKAAFASSVHFDPDLAIETFVLERPAQS